MSKRHRWGRVDLRGCGLYEVCLECLMRRRIRGAVISLVTGLTLGSWEYLPVNVSGWEHAQRTCGPCPGKGGA